MRRSSRTTTSLAIGGVAEAFAAVRALAATIPVEIEVDDLDGLREAIDAGADLVLLDNFDVDADARGGGAARRARAPHVLLEASGGLTVEVARAVGETGVDYIAVGELTHSARVLDIGLDLVADRAEAGSQNCQRVADVANAAVAWKANATVGGIHQIGPSGKPSPYFAAYASRKPSGTSATAARPVDHDGVVAVDAR